MAAAVTRRFGGELGRQLTHAVSNALRVGKIGRGRGLRAIVFRYYGAGDAAQLMIYINHRQETVLNGEDLEPIQRSCNMLTSELKKQPDLDILHHLCYRQVQRFSTTSRTHVSLQEGER